MAVVKTSDSVKEIHNSDGTSVKETVHKEEAFNKETEPDYVKLYFDMVFAFYGLKTRGVLSTLIYLLKGMTYANTESPNTIIINEFVKKKVCEETGKGIATVNRNIKELCDCGIFRKIAIGAYEVNANIFAKGKWNDVKKKKKIQGHFDCNTKEFMGIVENEPEEE